MRWVFTAAFLLSGIYHGAGLINPAWTEPATPVRHIVFMVINLAAAGIMIKAKGRALYLLFPLILQQIYSHGTYGQEVWMNEKRIDWASMLVMIGMPLLGIYIVKVNQARIKASKT